MIENTYNVHKSQWKKWSDASRRLFNDLMESAADQGLVNAHPKTTKLPPKPWYTIAWNFAWLAADYLRDQEREAKKAA